MKSTTKPLRTIKSYVCRQGRISSRQRSALEKFWNKYGLNLGQGIIDFNAIFDSNAPIVLEIGFGMGQSLISMAKSTPDKNFVGIEVHRPGVGALFAELAENNLTNVRAFCADANDVLPRAIPDQSIERIQIFFPDPWPKKRHHKRRLIQPEFIKLVLAKLIEGGQLQIATDWENYAREMMALLSNTKGLINLYGTGVFAPRPESRPLTKYEQRGYRFGHQVWDLNFVKRTE